MPGTLYADAPSRFLPVITRSSRYRNCIAALDTIRRHAVTNLHFLEVGTGDGALAAELLSYWKALGPGNKAVYHGFDLFTTASRKKAAAALKALGSEFSVRLNDGSPAELLAPGLPFMHLIIIRGSHNLDAIRDGWDALAPVRAPATITLFDNYYVDQLGYGCRGHVGMLASARRGDESRLYRVALLHPVDHADNAGLKTRMVRVLAAPEKDCVEAN